MIEFKIINKEDEIELTEEDVDNHNKEAEFNLSILVENKPYYFRYIYNESNKTWLTYDKRRQKVMKNSTMKSWEEVEQSNNRTQEEQEIFEIHTKKNPFSCEKGIDFTARKKLIKQSGIENEICKECSLNKRCKHTCACKNYLTTNNINGLSPIVCEFERIIIERADQIAVELYKQNSKLFIQKYYNKSYNVFREIINIRKGDG